MNYIKQEVLSLYSQEPLSFVRYLTNNMQPYFEYYALLQYKNITSFIKNFNNNKFFQIIGADGTGKSSFKEIIKNIFEENIKVFEYNCNEIAELDDIFYAFYKFMLKNPLRKELFRGGSSTFKPGSLDEQIIHYLKNMPPNTILLFDGFENLFHANGEIKSSHIQSFFEYIATLKNIKIIFIHTQPITASLSIVGGNIHTTELSGLSESEIKDFMSIFKVDAPQSLIKEIYTQTNGHINSLKLLAIAAKVFNLPLTAILKENTMRKENLNSYLIKKLFNKLSDNHQKVLSLFSLFRHEITPDVIKQLDGYLDVDTAMPILKSLMLLEGNDLYEVRDFIKNIIYNLLTSKEKMTLHEKIADLYANQIPLKPTERILDISRTGMYSEKFYHYNIFSKWSKNYSIQNTTELQPSTQDYRPDSQTIRYIASTQYLPDFDTKGKPLPNLNIELPNDEDYLKAEENDIFNFTAKYKPMKDILGNSNTTNNPLSEITSKYIEENNPLNMLEDDEFMSAKNLLQKAYELYNEGKTDESIDYFKKATPLLANKDKESFYLAKFSLARAYIDNFHHREASKELFELLEFDTPIELKIESLLELGGVLDAQERRKDAIDVYNKALKLAEKEKLKNLCAKAYFKIGLFYDEKNETEKALYNYLLAATDASELLDRSILASTYSNIASIYEDKDDMPKAIDFYKKSLKVDEYYKNFDGQTKSLSALGNIFLKKEDTPLALKLFVKATQTAKQTEDSYMIASSYLELGDAFFHTKDYKNALKAYLLSKRSIDSTISTDSKNKIERRFELIVDQIGEKNYRYLLQELKNK